MMKFLSATGVVLAIALNPGAWMAGASARWQAGPDCSPHEPAMIALYERAVAERPGDLPAQLELAVCYDQSWRFQEAEAAIGHAIVMLNVEMAGARSPQPASGSPPVAGEHVSAPRRISAKQPGYPDGTLPAGSGGFVVLELLLDEKGSVKAVRVVKASPQLEKAAVNAAKQWKYEPTLLEGKPTQVLTYVAVRFDQTSEPLPADWLQVSAAYYGLGLKGLTRATLQAAADKARSERGRFEGYVRSPRPPAPSIPGFTMPSLLKHVDPVYSRRALSAHQDGIVMLEALVDATGVLGRPRVMTKPSLLDVSAVRALWQWRFKPALNNGVPVPTAIEVQMEFRLK